MNYKRSPDHDEAELYLIIGVGLYAWPSTGMSVDYSQGTFYMREG